MRDKVESTTDPDARLYKKALADKAVPSYQGHALTENRNGLYRLSMVAHNLVRMAETDSG